MMEVVELKALFALGVAKMLLTEAENDKLLVYFSSEEAGITTPLIIRKYHF